MPRNTRFTGRARVGLTLMTGMLAFGMSAPEAHAQRVQTAGVPVNGGSPGLFPYYRVAPGLNLQQAAYNTALLGRAYARFPPWAMGYAPPYALGYSPLGNPGVEAPGTSQAMANSALFNPGLTALSTGGGYGWLWRKPNMSWAYRPRTASRLESGPSSFGSFALISTTLISIEPMTWNDVFGMT